jgi:hypothetical protein
MNALRHMLAQRCHAFLIAGLIALAVRAVVPAGYMPDAQPQAGSEAIVLSAKVCNASGIARTIDIAIAREDAGEAHKGAPASHDSAQQACAFAALAFAALGTPDAEPPAPAALHTAHDAGPLVAARVASPAFLRPPLRGPPLTA